MSWISDAVRFAGTATDLYNEYEIIEIVYPLEISLYLTVNRIVGCL